jgi:hypothetical protein
MFASARGSGAAAGSAEHAQYPRLRHSDYDAPFLVVTVIAEVADVAA